MLADADRFANTYLTTFAPALTGVIVAVFLIGPRTSPVLLLMLALVPLTWIPASELRHALARLPQPVAVAFAFGAYLLVTVAWSADRFEAIGKVALFFAIATAAWVASAAVARTGEQVLEKLVRTALIAVVIGLLYLCLEELTRHSLKRLVFTLLPETRLPARHMKVTEGTVTSIGLYATNRNMAALSLALWPALLAAQSTLAAAKGRLAALLIFAVALLTISLSQHDTSLVALAAGTLVFALATRWPRFSLGLVAAGWITATLFIVPIASLAYREASLHHASWLPLSARQRIILWGYTAEQVAGNAWLGVGVASTKTLDNERAATAETPPGFVYPLRTGPHAHNIYLQTWYELGAIGAVLFLGLGLAVLRSVARIPAALQRYALASFVSASVVGAFSWGMWQAWFMGAFGVAAVLTVLSLELAARRSDTLPRSA
jgi:hypothetical protein